MHVLCQQKVKSHCLVSLSSIFPFCCERESVSGSIMTDSLQLPGPQPARLLCPWNSPGKNTGVLSHPLLQGIFPTQGLNSGLLYCRQILYQLSYQGSPPGSYLSQLCGSSHLFLFSQDLVCFTICCPISENSRSYILILVHFTSSQKEVNFSTLF